MAGNLLVQEVHDPGISRVMEVITSNSVGDTLYSTEVTGGEDVAYTELVGGLLAREINVLAVNRGEETITTFKGVTSRPGDRVVYVAKRRRTWGELAEGAGGVASPS
jgi:voltage-gated potassium channel